MIKPGEVCGKLTSKAALETGLISGTPVASAIIDAHAGGIGVMGCTAPNVSPDFTTRLGNNSVSIKASEFANSFFIIFQL